MIIRKNWGHFFGNGKALDTLIILGKILEDGMICLSLVYVSIFRSLQVQNFKTKFSILLSTGINLNSADCNGETALHRACQYGNSMMIFMLLRAGAARNFCKLSRCYLSDAGAISEF